MIWSVRRDRRSTRLALGGLAALPVLLATSLLVVTPAERIIAVCRELARAVDEGDIAAIGARLSPKFESETLDKAAFLEVIERRLGEVRIDAPRLRSFNVEFPDADTGVATFAASGRVRTARMYGHFPSRWRLTFLRSGDTWLASRIEALPVPPLNVSILGRWLQ